MPGADDEELGLDETLSVNSTFREEASGALVHTLVVVQGEGMGRRVVLDGEPLAVGRSSLGRLVLSDPQVSKLHCELRLEGGRVRVRDLGSTNGTFLDGERVTEAVLAPESRLRLGTHVLRYELRDADEITRASELAQDLGEARAYVEAMLPPPLRSGPVTTEWTYVPSAALGGDGFGHLELPSGKLVLYLLDVTGHGVRSALHATAAMNVLRRRSLPDVDFSNPREVVERLDEKFPIDDHHGLFFTLWYGVYDPTTRILAYTSAGHPPALLLTQRGLQQLHCHNPPVGTLAGARILSSSLRVAPGARLFLMSDNVYEIVDREGERWGFDAVEPLVLTHGAAPDATRLIHQAVLAASSTPTLEDDFSLLAATFA